MEVPDEEYGPLRIDLALHRHLAVLRRLIERDVEEAVARPLFVHDRLHRLLQIAEHESFQFLLHRALHVVQEPGDAEEEVAFAGGDGNPLSRANLTLAVDLNDLAAEIDRQLVLKAGVFRGHFVAAERQAFLDQLVRAVAELRCGR